MLTREMKNVISLLKEIAYMQGHPVREQSLPETSRTKVRKLLDCLCREGLLRIMGGTGCDPLYYCYALCYPLQEITLCDLLRVTGGTIHLSVDDTKEIYEDYGMAGRRLGVMNDMACHFLSQINLTEIILPQAPTEIPPEEVIQTSIEKGTETLIEERIKTPLEKKIETSAEAPVNASAKIPVERPVKNDY